MDISVRRITDTELETALALAWDVFQAYEAPDYSEEGVRAFYKSIHEPKWLVTLQLYGAFSQDELVGMLAASNNASHIALFFVKGIYHRMGIGRNLFDSFLKESPAATITVNASPYAVPVYHKLGFVETDKEQTTNGIRYTPMKRDSSQQSGYQRTYACDREEGGRI